MLKKFVLYLIIVLLSIFLSAPVFAVDTSSSALDTSSIMTTAPTSGPTTTPTPTSTPTPTPANSQTSNYNASRVSTSTQTSSYNLPEKDLGLSNILSILLIVVGVLLILLGVAVLIRLKN